MANSIDSRIAKGAMWSFLEQFSVMGIQFAVSVVLARLLLPADFGIVGMLAIFIALARAVVEGGFGKALIQKKDLQHLDECSMFFFNIGMGLLSAVVLILVGPAIAAFFGVPLLTKLLRVLAFCLVIDSISIVQLSLMSRRMDFRRQMKATLFAVVLSGAAGIGCAFGGLGVWALVVQSLVSSAVRGLALWKLCRWRPSWQFSWGSIRTMFRFGSHMFLASVLQTVFDNIHTFVIGRFFTPVDLGMYSRSKRTIDLSARSFMGVLHKVLFPALSGLQSSHDECRRVVKRSLVGASIVIFPAMAGMAVVAEDFVIGVFGEKWEPSVPYLRVLCMVGACLPLISISQTVLSSMGKSATLLKLLVFRRSLHVVAIVVTLPHGIIWMLVGQALCELFGLFIAGWQAGRVIGYGVFRQLRDVWAVAAIAVVMGGLVMQFGSLVSGGHLFSLLCKALIGLVFYLACLKLFCSEATKDLVRGVRERET